MERNDLTVHLATAQESTDPVLAPSQCLDATGDQVAPLPRMRVTVGDYNQAGPWTDRRELSWQDLILLLTIHRSGPKAGSCIVPAVFRGKKRQKAYADQIDVAFLDSDTGHTLEEIKAAIVNQR